MKLRKLLNDPPKDYYSRLAQVESNNNPLAKAKTSSAAGLYQFTESTWNQLTQELGLNYTLDDRFDPEKSRKVVQEFTNRNERTLKNKLGRKPNDAELYLAHFSGAGGASKLLDTVQNNPNASVTDFVSPAALKANKNVFYNKNGTPKKAYEIYNWSAKKFDSPTITPEESSLVSNVNRERRETVIDNTAVRKPRIPSLATSPINPNYAELPEAEKQEINKEKAISENQVRQLLEQERQATENRFLSAFQQQNASEDEYYTPQPQEEDLSHLYDYIDINNYQDGGKQEECECGCPGKPPCPDIEVESENDPRYKAYVDSLQLHQKSHKLRSVLNNLKGNDFKGSKKHWKAAKDDLTNTLLRVKKDHGSLDNFEPNSFFTGANAIKGDNKEFPRTHPNFNLVVNQNKNLERNEDIETNDAIFTLYSKPKQKVVVKPKSRKSKSKPREKLAPIDTIKPEGIKISEDILSQTKLPKIKVPQPKYWEVEIQVNQGLGSHTTKKRVHSLEELEKLKIKQAADEKSKTGKNNKLIITPKYK